MRYLAALILVAGLVGCTSPRPRGALTAGGDSSNPRPFVGSPGPDKEKEPSAAALARRPLGMLAGSVWLDRRPVANATIRVTSLDHGEKPPTKLTVRTDSEGWFSAPGLEKGQRYQLVATAKRGEQSWRGLTLATANDVRVVVYLSDSAPPSELEAGPASKAEGGVTTPTAPESLPAPEGPPAPPPVPFDPKRVAGTQPGRDFDKVPPPVPATIPGPGGDRRKPLVPPPPMRDEAGVTKPLPGAKPAVPLAAPPSGKRAASVASALVPSCVLTGNQVENFALHDFQGNRWELAERQTGKMVLLHFWSLDCVYCPPSIPRLVEFQRKWGGKGLQVVSVLHDEGDLARRKQGVLSIATRFEARYNFPVLFSERNCPVRKTMGVHAYPTFILLDEAGRVVHRCEGLNEINRLDIEGHLKRGLPK